MTSRLKRSTILAVVRHCSFKGECMDYYIWGMIAWSICGAGLLIIVGVYSD